MLLFLVHIKNKNKYPSLNSSMGYGGRRNTIPSAEILELSRLLYFKPGLGVNIVALRASPDAGLLLPQFSSLQFAPTHLQDDLRPGITVLVD